MSAAACRRLAAPVWQFGSIGVRQLSSGSSAPAAPAQLDSLKAALRAIYRRVHPDLFQDYQPAKDANTRSFKMLNEYVEAARTGSKVPLPYRFHFYIRSSSGSGGHSSSSSSAGAAGAESTDAPSSSSSPAAGQGQAGEVSEAGAAESGGDAEPAVPAGLHEVTLTLPPPTRGGPGEAMSGSTRKAFGRLLAALGLPSSFGSGEGEEDAAAQYSRFVSLREFLPQAVEAVHQHAAAQSSAAQQLAVLRTALRLGRHITAGFGGPAASAGALQQLTLLQRLAATLDALPAGANLQGLTISVGQASGVDALGTVWLAADGSQEAWFRHLLGVDAEHCRERRRLRQQIKAQEVAVAAALGLSMLYTQPEASMGPQYRHALERLAAAAAQRGPVGGGRFRGLPVMLRLPGEAGPSSGGSSSSSSGLGGCSIDPAAGLLLSPMDVPADALYTAVERLGEQVVAALKRRRQQEADLAALRQKVERKVMLRRLLRDPALSDARYKSCMERMLASAQKLSGLLHGQAVRVAEVNGLSPDRAVIDIAWNWQL